MLLCGFVRGVHDPEGAAEDAPAGAGAGCVEVSAADFGVGVVVDPAAAPAPATTPVDTGRCADGDSVVGVGVGVGNDGVDGEARSWLLPMMFVGERPASFDSSLVRHRFRRLQPLISLGFKVSRARLASSVGEVIRVSPAFATLPADARVEAAPRLTKYLLSKCKSNPDSIDRRRFSAELGSTPASACVSRQRFSTALVSAGSMVPCGLQISISNSPIPMHYVAQSRPTTIANPCHCFSSSSRTKHVLRSI